MAPRFIACAACVRHVRAGDAVCPFCGATAPTPAPRRVLRGRFSRATLGAAGALGATFALADCSSAGVSTNAFYGGFCTGTSCEGGGPAADAADVSTAVFYGLACPDGSSCLPPIDTGADTITSPDGTSGIDGSDGSPPDGGSD